MPAREHVARGFASGQVAGETGHLPGFEVNPRRGFDDRKGNIAADIEYRNFDRADLSLDPLHQRDHLFLAARVKREGNGGSSGCHDRLCKRLQPVGIAACDARDVALAREAARNGAAQRVAGADDQCDLVRCHLIPRRSTM